VGTAGLALLFDQEKTQWLLYLYLSKTQPLLTLRLAPAFSYAVRLCSLMSFALAKINNNNFDLGARE